MHSERAAVPPLNDVQIAGRARRAERYAAIDAVKIAAAERAAKRAKRVAKDARLVRALAMQETLAMRFPATFKMSGTRPPMKVGIHKDITDLAPDLDAADVSQAIRLYVRNGSYTQAVVAGAVRYDLDGNAAGVVTEIEARWPFKRKEPA